MSKKILWSEGLLLSQQHLQYLESSLQKQIRQSTPSRPFNFGLQQLEINEALLELGTIAVRSVSGIMPNGLILCRLRSEPELRWCSPELKAGQTIYLKMANTENVDHIPGYSTNTLEQSIAWHAKAHQLSDLHDSTRVAEVTLLEPKLFLSHQAPNQSTEIGLPIALIKSGEKGKIVLEPNFFPPLLNVGAHYELFHLLEQFEQKMYQVLNLIKETLDTYNWSSHHQKRIIVTTEATSLLAIYATKLKHSLYENQHPRSIFCLLSELAYALQMLLARDIINLPEYQHSNSYEVWLEILERIESLFKVLQFDASSSLKLIKESSQLYYVSGLKRENLKDSHLIFKVKFQSGLETCHDEFTRQVKVSTKKDIASILASALPGIKIDHNTFITQQFPKQPGVGYYHLISEGPLWAQVIQERNLSIFLPEKYNDAQIELISVAH